MKTTLSPKANEIQRDWWLIDASGLVLGRMATEVASRLRGKHKPFFSPHLDCGDHVIIVNAAQVVLTADKAEKKKIWRHSGYPGGIRSRTYQTQLDLHPEEAIRQTIKGMLPKNRLGRQMISKLKVYADDTHPHTAQKPMNLDLPQAKAREDVRTAGAVAETETATGAATTQEATE